MNRLTREMLTRIKCLLRIITLASIYFVGIGAVAAAELLIVEQEDCPYCKKFDREIATAYPNTEEGSLAPLHRIDMHAQWPEKYARIQQTQLTPTFILVDNGQEIDRLVGYPGDEYFWFLLGEMLDKLHK